MGIRRVVTSARERKPKERIYAINLELADLGIGDY